MAHAFSSFQMEIHFPDSITMEKETGWEPISFQMAQNEGNYLKEKNGQGTFLPMDPFIREFQTTCPTSGGTILMEPTMGNMKRESKMERNLTFSNGGKFTEHLPMDLPQVAEPTPSTRFGIRWRI